MQLLDKLDLKENYEVAILNFIQTAVLEAVSVFQTQTLPPQSVSTSAALFTGQQLGDLILQAVSGKTPAEVYEIRNSHLAFPSYSICAHRY